MQIIIPKQYVGITPLDSVIFLAGPVLGGGDWQRVVIEHFMIEMKRQCADSFCSRVLPRIKFVVPCRWDASHPLSCYFAKQYSTVEEKGVIEAGQTYWEIHYLENIIKKRQGFIFFGLFPESQENPRTDGVPYGTDTRGELGRWPTIAHYEEAMDLIFIGAHPEFVQGALISNLHCFAGSGWLSANLKEIHTPKDFAVWLVSTVWRRLQ